MIFHKRCYINILLYYLKLQVPWNSSTSFEFSVVFLISEVCNRILNIFVLSQIYSMLTLSLSLSLFSLCLALHWLCITADAWNKICYRPISGRAVLAYDACYCCIGWCLDFPLITPGVHCPPVGRRFVRLENLYSSRCLSCFNVTGLSLILVSLVTDLLVSILFIWMTTGDALVIDTDHG